MNTAKEKIVLAFSGGLDTSAIIPWLKLHYDCDVYALAADVGQNPDELIGVKDKAIALGAADCEVVDLKEALVKDCIFPMAKINARYENRYLLGTAIARPYIAKAQVEYALAIGATALCHGCTGKGNDQIRFEMAYASLAPDLKVIAPWREWEMQSREDLHNFIIEQGLSSTAQVNKQYSRDENLWHLSHEGDCLEDPWCAPEESMWQLTRPLSETPDTPEEITLGFKAGALQSINGKQVTPFQGIKQLNELGGLHGVGRIDIVENRTIGMKSRGCYETPAGTILYAALEALEELVLDKESSAFKRDIAERFAQQVYEGKWFTPLMTTLLNTADNLCQTMTGEVVLALHKGHALVKQRRSPDSLYDHDYATFDDDDVYDQHDAAGFIRLFSLSSRIQNQKLRTKKGDI